MSQGEHACSMKRFNSNMTTAAIPAQMGTRSVLCYASCNHARQVHMQMLPTHFAVTCHQWQVHAKGASACRGHDGQL